MGMWPEIIFSSSNVPMTGVTEIHECFHYTNAEVEASPFITLTSLKKDTDTLVSPWLDVTAQEVSQKWHVFLWPHPTDRAWPPLILEAKRGPAWLGLGWERWHTFPLSYHWLHSIEFISSQTAVCTRDRFVWLLLKLRKNLRNSCGLKIIKLEDEVRNKDEHFLDIVERKILRKYCPWLRPFSSQPRVVNGLEATWYKTCRYFI